MRIPNFGPFLAFSIIGTVTLLPLLVLPAMVGVLVDNAAMTDSSAGFSASAHFLAGATAGLSLAVRIHHLNLRRLSRLALIGAIAADIASAFTVGDSIFFFASRIAAGLALGSAYVASVAAFARYDDYERGYGLFVTLQFVVSGLGLYIVPVFADELGGKGLFLAFAAADTLALFLVSYLPMSSGSAAKQETGESEFAVLLKYSALLAILGFAVFEAANNAQFAFIERFGVSLTISDHKIGMALLIASLIGIPGAFIVVLVGGRFGTLLPLIFGIAIALTGLVVLINADRYIAYLIGGCCMGFSWAFCLPFIQSLLATIDRQGSAIAAGSAFATVGSAAGPGLASIVVVGGRYVDVFLLSVGLFTISVVLFVMADKTRKQHR
ncbi:MAG TPA: MFS transporter [Woeseiaceae bacterium]|nr:MFS transporter [Woeseiaceae bacterium]